MTQEQIEYGERYFYRDIEEFEATTGFKLAEGPRMAWEMARTKNKDLGIFGQDKEEHKESNNQ